MLLKLRAKVNLFVSEDKMEVDSTYDLGNIAGSKEWLWKDVGLPVETVRKVISYNSSKSVVQLYEDDEQILVAEPFDIVFDKWRTALYEYHNVIDVEADDTSREEDLVLGDDEDDED